jgi:hypothetical protein
MNGFIRNPEIIIGHRRPGWTGVWVNYRARRSPEKLSGKINEFQFPISQKHASERNTLHKESMKLRANLVILNSHRAAGNRVRGAPYRLTRTPWYCKPAQHKRHLNPSSTGYVLSFHTTGPDIWQMNILEYSCNISRYILNLVVQLYIYSVSGRMTLLLLFYCRATHYTGYNRTYISCPKYA